VLTNLVGDGVHNFVDGIAVATAFMASPELGLATSIAVLAHEVPKEVGDFGIFVSGGLTVRRAILVNVAAALLAFVGAALMLLVGARFGDATLYLLPVVAGAFIYIAGANLVPHLHDAPGIRTPWGQLGAILVGIGLTLLPAVLGLGHSHGGAGEGEAAPAHVEADH
jgi:zinc and cadmium transporter